VWTVVAEDSETDEADADEVQDDATEPLWVFAVRGSTWGEAAAAADEANQDGGDTEEEGNIPEIVDVHGVSPWVEDCCAEDCTAANVPL
jgi:hypothetical protein